MTVKYQQYIRGVLHWVDPDGNDLGPVKPTKPKVEYKPKPKANPTPKADK